MKATFIIQSAFVFVQVRNGFGKTLGHLSTADVVMWQQVWCSLEIIDPSEFEDAEFEDINEKGKLTLLFQTAFVCDILYILILWLTKCSVAVLFIRLTPDSKHVAASYIVLAESTMLMIVSQLLIAIRCDESRPWIFVEVQCGDLAG